MGKGGSKVDLTGPISEKYFELGRVLGRGSFGKVHAISRRDNNKLYAMKLLRKRELIQKKMVKRTIEERKLLTEIKHPLIVNLHFAFQNDCDLCMVVDIMTGGDLRYHLDKECQFAENRVRFYASQCVLSLDYLHQSNIIHRDIKPDNLLLDENGYCHLTDFNVSVRFKPGETVKGVAGTMSYMAPEVLEGVEGYGPAVDYWSLGVVIYEMLTGRLPFSGESRDMRKAAILNMNVKFPRSDEVSLSPNCIDFMKKLLAPADQRWGAKELKTHPWFSGLDWNAIEQKSMVAPFIPNRNRANVDGRFDLEDQFASKKKKKDTMVEPEQQAQFGDWDWNCDATISADNLDRSSSHDEENVTANPLSTLKKPSQSDSESSSRRNSGSTSINQQSKSKESVNEVLDAQDRAEIERAAAASDSSDSSDGSNKEDKKEKDKDKAAKRDSLKKPKKKEDKAARSPNLDELKISRQRQKSAGAMDEFEAAPVASGEKKLEKNKAKNKAR